MNPKYIFSAFFAVACLLSISLPRLSNVEASQAQTTPPAPSAAAGYVPPSGGSPQVQISSGLAQDTQVSGETALGASSVAFSADPTPAASGSIPLTSYNQTTLTGLPDLATFISSVAPAPAGVLVGVYVPGIFALPVIQQPVGNHDFVSPVDYTLTQYAAPAQFGTTAILAHNYLSGRSFFQLQPGQEVVLVYGDGSLEKFRIAEIEQFQALNSTDPYSDFVDLSDPTGRVQPYSNIFQSIYTQPDRLVFQTCIDFNGDPSWGRIFIVADPL